MHDLNDLVLRVLSESKQKLVASPGLLQRIRRPREPAELSTLPSLSWDSFNPEQVWRLEGPNGATVHVPHRPRLITENMMALRRGAAGDRDRAASNHGDRAGACGR